MRALVTSTRAPHALVAIRELARRGWQITAADCTRLSYGARSRHVDRFVRFPDLTREPDAWTDALLAELEATRHQLLLPCFEDVFAVARVHDRLPAHTRVPVGDYDALVRMHHKMRLFENAAGLGVRVPESWQPRSIEEVAELPVPAVLKLPDGNNSLGLAMADDHDTLVRQWSRLCRFFRLEGDRLPVVQRRIDGDLFCTLALAHDGERLGQLVYRPLLMFPDGGGTAFCREAVRHDAIEALSDRVLEQSSWNGFLGLDVVVERETGELFVIDANPRPSPALNLGQRAGVDFVGLLDAFARDQAIEPAPSATAGIKTKTMFVHALWLVFSVFPGRRWWQRVRRAWYNLRLRGFHPDVHDPRDRAPSFWMFLYVFYFMFVVNALRPRDGGFMFGCNWLPRDRER